MQRHQTTTAALEDVAGSGNGPGAAAGAAGRGDHKTAAALEYAGGGGAGGAGGEGAAGHGDRVGDERERDDTWDPRVSVYVCVKLNKWIAKLLEGTTK